MVINLITFASILHKQASVRSSHEVILTELEKYFTVNFIDYKDIDEIALIIDPWRHNLPTDNEDFFPAIEYEYLPFDGNVFRLNQLNSETNERYIIEFRKR